jgi:hypothetical protein
MIYLFILLLIPLFFVGMVMYVNTLYDFVINSNIDTVLLLVGVFISIISIFILFKLLFLLGIALIINAFIDSLSYSKLILGSSIVSMYLYIVYYYFIQKSVVMFKVEDMYKLNNDLYMVILYNKDIGKVETYELKSKLKKNKTYKCLYNKGSNMILRISNEVIEVE